MYSYELFVQRFQPSVPGEHSVLRMFGEESEEEGKGLDGQTCVLVS